MYNSSHFTRQNYTEKCSHMTLCITQQLPTVPRLPKYKKHAQWPVLTRTSTSNVEVHYKYHCLLQRNWRTLRNHRLITHVNAKRISKLKKHICEQHHTATVDSAYSINASHCVFNTHTPQPYMQITQSDNKLGINRLQLFCKPSITG